MSRRAGFILFLLVLFIGLTLVIVLAFEDALRKNLIEPVLYSLWYVERIGKTINPDLFWGALILVITVSLLVTYPLVQMIVGRILSVRLPSLGRGSSPETAPWEQGGQVGFWHLELQQIFQQPHITRYSLVELKKLILDVIAFREQLASRQEAEAWLEENEKRFPVEIRLLFQPEKGFTPARMPSFLNWLWEWILHLGLARPQASVVIEEHSLEAILRFLEDQPGAGSD